MTSWQIVLPSKGFGEGLQTGIGSSILDQKRFTRNWFLNISWEGFTKIGSEGYTNWHRQKLVPHNNYSKVSPEGYLLTQNTFTIHIYPFKTFTPTLGHKYFTLVAMKVIITLMLHVYTSALSVHTVFDSFNKLYRCTLCVITIVLDKGIIIQLFPFLVISFFT